MNSSEELPRVLLVDDRPENIEVLAESLGGEFQLLVALNGQKALDIALQDDPPDIILLDVIMPEMDGYEVCRRLKKDPTTRDVPVIFVTSMNDDEDEKKGFELGAVDFITKPLSPAIVRARVQTHLALKEARERIEGFSEKLSRYLSPQIKQSILEGKQDARIGSSRKKLTVFFSDIVNFSAQTDHMEPEDLTILLNSYLDKMANIALKHGGTLDKFIGDAVLVFFGDPESRGIKQDAHACIRMALEMQLAIEELKLEWRKTGIVSDFDVRMGVTSGYCTVGNFGSDARMDYTIVGNQVNLAARFESNASPGTILITEETYSLVSDEFHCIAKEPVDAKGFPHPVPAFQVIGEKSKLGEDGSIESELDGFSIRLNPDEIDSSKRQEVIEKLRSAISSLK